MNIQQFTNPQFWTSLFPGGGVLLSISSMCPGNLVVVFLIKAIVGTKIMISWGHYLFLEVQFLYFLGLTTISWLINQVITYGVIALVVISPWSDWFRTSGSSDRSALRQ